MTVQAAGAAIEDVMRLSPLQQGLFSRAVLEGADAAEPYLITMAADVSGPLDAALLHQCVAAILVRHPNLRVSFAYQNLPHPVQVVPSHAEPPWRHVRTTSERMAALEADERHRPFDLERGPLIRFLLADLSDGLWRFVITAHHIIIDGWSLPVLVAEVLTLYRAGGDTDSLGPPPRPYRDYIGWLSGRDDDDSTELWLKHLAELPGPTLLSPALALSQPSGLASRTELGLDPAETNSLVESARARGVTLSTLLQVAWAIVLARFTDRDDVLFGVTVSGRPADLTAVESMVGLFINTIPLRVRVDSDMTVEQLCARVQNDAAQLRECSHLTHARLRSIGGVGEMFDTLLVFENFPTGGVVDVDEFHAGAVTFRPAALESLAHFPVTIAATLTNARLQLMVEAVEHALGATDPRMLGRRVLRTVAAMVAGWDQRVGDIDVLMPGEAGEICLPDCAVASNGGFADRFASVAAATPDAVALNWDDGQLTYRDLNAAVDRAAARLTERGVGPEVHVVVRVKRGPDYVVALLAVLRAGGVCVPLEADIPEQRVASILGQIGAAVTVEDPILEATAPSELALPPTDPDQGAYVVFTSGTSGEPKGVVGTHRALLAYAEDHADRVLRPAADRLGRPLRIAHAWSFAFDAAWQPLVALLEGHSVHIVCEHDRRDPEALTRLIAEQQIDMLDTTPSMFGQLRECGLLDEVSLEVLALGGEAVGPTLWADIAKISSRTEMVAVNCYGPTETTVESVVGVISDHDSPMIGYPTRYVAAAVLDSKLRPVPDGVLGELYLAGEQLTRGYLHRPAETAARYVSAPGGGRMYRTGDLVRRHPGGALQFIGRADAQVKIRGYRVEPGEIEAVLLSHPSVKSARVLTGAGPVNPRLTAFVAGTPIVAELRTLLRSRLPRYMTPHRLMVVDDVPLTENGKPDDALLRTSFPESASIEMPNTETEKLLAEVFLELFDMQVVDVDADVLELGLDSITALSVVQAVRRRGVPLRARLIAEYPTVRELAAAIDANPFSETTSAEPDGPIPLLPAGLWLYEHGDPRRLAQTNVIRLPSGATAAQLRTMLDSVVASHPILRCELNRRAMTMTPSDAAGWPLTETILEGDEYSAISQQTASAVDSLAPEDGSLLSAVWLHEPNDSGVLILVAHVLALDPASWRVVLAELDAAWHSIQAGLSPNLPVEQTTCRSWAEKLSVRANQLDTIDFWVSQLDGEDPPLGARRVDPASDRAGDQVLTVSMADEALTDTLLRSEPTLQYLLIAAAVRTMSHWRMERGQPQTAPLLALETHGRAERVISDADTSDTVGLLTSIYPLRFSPGGTAEDVATRLEAVPGDGIDYGLLRYLRADCRERLCGFNEPQLLLNYLGRTDIHNPSPLQVSHHLAAAAPLVPEPGVAVRHELWMVAGIVHIDGAPRLAVQWRTLPSVLADWEVARLQTIWGDSLQELGNEMNR